MIDKVVNKAYIVRDDSEDLKLILAIVKAKIFYQYDLLCGIEKRFKFAFDNECFYLIDARDKREAKSIVRAIKKKPGVTQKRIIRIKIKDKDFYLPYVYAFRV